MQNKINQSKILINKNDDMAKKNKETQGRVIRVTKQDNRIFRQLLLDLYDHGIFRTPDELADELFSLGLHVKEKSLRDVNKTN